MLIRRLITLWQQSFSVRQTQYFVLGLLSAYGAYVLWLGVRPVVILSGAIVCVLVCLVWLLLPEPTITEDDSNLLEPTIFSSRLDTLLSLPETSINSDDFTLHSLKEVRAQAKTIHKLAVTITHQEPLLVPDVIETLHTVLALSSQIALTLSATQQMETTSYQDVAQQQFSVGAHRLGQTYQHLQQLHDQLLAEEIKTGALVINSVVSARLQTLIETNKSEITNH